MLVLSVLLLTFPCKSQEMVSYKGVTKDAYNFWVYTPSDYDAAAMQPKPLVVFLHGASLRGNDLNRVRRYGTLHALEMGLKLDAVVLAPQCNSGSWNSHRIMNTINWVSEHYVIDSCRIYVLGMSLGGYGTIEFAGTYPGRVAAAMAICGGGNLKDYCNLNDVPLWILHGTVDRAVPIGQSQKVVSAMDRCGVSDRLIFTKLPGYNHTQPAKILYMKETYDWLFEHRLDDPGRDVNRGYDINTTNIPRAYNSSDRAHADSIKVKSGSYSSKSPASASVDDRVGEGDDEAAPSAATSSSPQYYTVKRGDTLSAIARRYHTTVAKLCQFNKIKATTTLQIGRRLRVR